MMKEKYESLPLATLKDLAKARGLKGISTMKKAELIERMLEEDEKVKNNAKETVKELSANTGDKEVHDIDKLDSGITVRGILEVMQDGYGFIRSANYLPGDNDVYVSPSQIRRFNLKTGDILEGNTRIKTQQEKFSALLYLSKVNNGQEDITIQNFISRRSTHDEWTSGGSRTIMFPCRTVITPETDFLSAAYEIQNMQNRIYMHSNYDPAFIMDEMRKRYNTPEHTGYESCYLTYQPMTVKVENEMLGAIRQHAKWFANGAATKKMYLTVSHTEDGGMNFSYHYQTAHLEEHDMELLYYYMMRILFKGIAEPDMSIGEIMELV